MSRTSALGILLVAAALAACASGPPPLSAGESIGEPIAARAPLPLATVMQSPDGYREQTLLVEATVANVCRSKGCWMQVEGISTHDPSSYGSPDPAEACSIMVRWETGCGGRYKFPIDAVGRRVLIQGSFYPKEISEEDARHLEEESGGKPIPRTTWEMNASGVIVVAERDR